MTNKNEYLSPKIETSGDIKDIRDEDIRQLVEEILEEVEEIDTLPEEALKQDSKDVQEAGVSSEPIEPKETLPYRTLAEVGVLSTFAAYAYEQGMSMKDLMKIVGIASIATTSIEKIFKYLPKIKKMVGKINEMHVPAPDEYQAELTKRLKV